MTIMSTTYITPSTSGFRISFISGAIASLIKEIQQAKKGQLQRFVNLFHYKISDMIDPFNYYIHILLSISIMTTNPL